MSRISQLEVDIQECQENIRKLQEKEEQLEEAKRQNGVAANETGAYISSRRSYAGNIHQYGRRTTIAKLIATKIEANYSRAEEVKLLCNYDEIEKELTRAIQRIEDEIEEQNRTIRENQRKIEEIREEERRERERREREREERERREKNGKCRK